MTEIPGFPKLSLTDEHMRQAQELVRSIKDANPQHADAIDKMEDGLRHIVGAAAGIVAFPLLALFFLGGRPNAFM